MYTFNKKGQTLIMLLVFMIVAITVTSAATILILLNSSGAQKYEGGTVTYMVAESGMENAILRLLRNPFYTGETLPVNGGTAVISVTGSNPYTITSIGSKDGFSRTIQVVVNYNGNMTITSWKEIF